MSNSEIPGNEIRPASPMRDDDYIYYGNTKREHFAGLAMQGFISSGKRNDADIIAVEAVEAADALLAALDCAEC